MYDMNLKFKQNRESIRKQFGTHLKIYIYESYTAGARIFAAGRVGVHSG